MRLSLVAASICCAAALCDTPARAEGWLFHRKPNSWHDRSSVVYPPGSVIAPSPTTPMTPTDPNAVPPKVDPMAPSAPMTTPTPDFAPVTSAALGDAAFAVSAPGYIDFAMPMNQIRLRYDSAYNNNRPDRAEYFYAKCGCFGGDAPGPILPERSVDFQEGSLYIELAPTERFSVFVDLPFRSINPEVNENASGFSDLRFGFKYAFIYDECQILTFQLRGYVPTGDARQGLGTDHVSLEPALLYTRRLSDTLTLYGEFGEWLPIGGTDFQGNILIYGAGLGYTAYDSGSFRVTPLAEMVGWTVLSGQELNPNVGGAVAAGGDTIINGKLGVRAGGPRQDFYLGYGRALTGEVWYEEIVRFEYRFKF
jgi:hypothetical protein